MLTMPAGVRLDLGATAKAWAADRSAARIAARTGGGVLVSLGGDIAVAGPAPATGWRVRVQDVTGAPEDPPAYYLRHLSEARRAWCWRHWDDPRLRGATDDLMRALAPLFPEPGQTAPSGTTTNCRSSRLFRSFSSGVISGRKPLRITLAPLPFADPLTWPFNEPLAPPLALNQKLLTPVKSRPSLSSP